MFRRRVTAHLACLPGVRRRVTGSLFAVTAALAPACDGNDPGSEVEDPDAGSDASVPASGGAPGKGGTGSGVSGGSGTGGAGGAVSASGGAAPGGAGGSAIAGGTGAGGTNGTGGVDVDGGSGGTSAGGSGSGGTSAGGSGSGGTSTGGSGSGGTSAGGSGSGGTSAGGSGSGGTSAGGAGGATGGAGGTGSGGAGSGGTGPSCIVETCANGTDDDTDGDADCSDADCAAAFGCVPRERCGNGVDDDGTNGADCQDPACSGHPSCQTGWDPRFRPAAAASLSILDVATHGDDVYVAGPSQPPVDGVTSNGVARFDGVRWHDLGAGIGTNQFNEGVQAIALDAGGTKLYAAGTFTTAGGAPAKNAAVWDVAGQTWSALGTGLDGPAHAALVSGTTVYYGGFFDNAGGVPASGVAAWSTTSQSWSALGTSPFDAARALTMVGGTLYAGGTGAGGGLVARWTGTTWESFPSADQLRFLLGEVYALATDGTRVFAGGSLYFSEPGVGDTSSGIAVLDPASGAWSPLGAGLQYPTGVFKNPLVRALEWQGTDLLVGGAFELAGGVPTRGVARWDGCRFSPVHSGAPFIDAPWLDVRTLTVDAHDRIWAGGDTDATARRYLRGLAVDDGAGWRGLGQGTFSLVDALATDGAGRVYAGGPAGPAGDVRAGGLARWDGNDWESLGTFRLALGPTTYDGRARSLAIDGGTLFVAGQFTSIDGLPAGGLAAYDIATRQWQGIDAFSSSSLLFLDMVATGGSVYVGSDFATIGGVSANNVARYDVATSTWSPLGAGITNVYNGGLRAVAALQGSVYYGGEFGTADGAPATNIARWDGSAWHTLGLASAEGTNGTVVDLLTVGGALYVVGSFTSVGGIPASCIARWDGASWAALGAGLGGCQASGAFTLASDGTTLYVAGDFGSAGGSPAAGLAAYDLTQGTWTPMTTSVQGLRQMVLSMTVSDGLYLAGEFLTAGGESSVNIARWVP